MQVEARSGSSAAAVSSRPAEQVMPLHAPGGTCPALGHAGCPVLLDGLNISPQVSASVTSFSVAQMP